MTPMDAENDNRSQSFERMVAEVKAILAMISWEPSEATDQVSFHDDSSTSNVQDPSKTSTKVSFPSDTAARPNDNTTSGLMPGSFADSSHKAGQLFQPTHQQRLRKVYTGSPYPQMPPFENSFSETSSPQYEPPLPRSQDRSVSRGRRSRRSTSPKPQLALIDAPSNTAGTTPVSQENQRSARGAIIPLSTEHDGVHSSSTPRSVSRGRRSQRAAPHRRLTFADLIEQRSRPSTPQPTGHESSNDGLAMCIDPRNDHTEQRPLPESQHGPSAPQEDTQLRVDLSSQSVQKPCAVLGELYSILGSKEQEQAARSQGNTVLNKYNLPNLADQADQHVQRNNETEANAESNTSPPFNMPSQHQSTTQQHQTLTNTQADEEACFSDSDTDDILSQPIPIPLSSDHRLFRTRQCHGSPLFDNYIIQHRHDEVCKLRNTPPHLRRFLARHRAPYQRTLHTAQLARRVWAPIPGSWYINTPARDVQAIPNGVTVNRDTDLVAPYAAVPGPVHVRRFASPASASLFALSESIEDSTASFHSATSSIPRRQLYLENIGAGKTGTSRKSSIEEGASLSVSSGRQYEQGREEEERFWQDLGLQGSVWSGSWSRSS